MPFRYNLTVIGAPLRIVAWTSMNAQVVQGAFGTEFSWLVTPRNWGLVGLPAGFRRSKRANHEGI